MRFRSPTLAVVLGVGLVSALAPVPARAEDAPAGVPAPSSDAETPEARAEVRFKRARQLYDEGEFALSLVEFQRAYELSPNYRVLYNIGQVNIQLSSYAAARTALERYLKDGGDEIPPARREQVEADLRMLRDRTGYVRIRTTPPADVTIDDAPVAATALDGDILVTAGRRKLVATKPGYAAVSRLVTLAGGERAEVDIELSPLVVEKKEPVVVAPRDAAPPERKNYTPAIIGWAATGTLAVGAAIVGGFYLGKAAEIRDMRDPERRSVSREEADNATASADRLALTADLLAVAAVIAGGVSVYLTLKPPVTGGAASATATSVVVGPGSVRGTF